MKKYLGLRGSRLSAAVSVAAGLCFFLFGYDQGDLAGLLTVPSFLQRFPQVNTIDNKGNVHVATIQGVTVGTWNLGCFVSAMITVFLGDRLGRKRTIMMGVSFLIIGEVIQASSYSFGQLIAGRFIAGFGNGFNTATVPAYQAECSKAHRKGTMLMISAGACIAGGLAFSYFMDFAFAWLDPSSASWRAPIAIQLFFALLTLVLVAMMPESPRWLILSGREEAALDVLSALNDTDASSEEVRQLFLQIKDAVIEMAKTSVASTFQNGDYRHLHRTLLAFMLQIMQQMSGINLITQYFALMFIQQYAYSGWMARLLAACAGLEFFIASFVAVIGIDRFWGRRSLMLFGSTGMAISMVVLTVMAYVNTRPTLIAGTVFVFVFGTFFAIGWQGMAWLYQVEVVPLRIRGPANALSTAANWAINFVVVLIAPVAFNNIGYRTYIIFAVTNAVTVPIIYFFYPEMGFRSLEEVDMIFHQASVTPHPWLTVVKIANKEPLWHPKRGGNNGFEYSASNWHQQHLHFGDETSSSEGEQRRLRGAAFGVFPTGDSSETTTIAREEVPSWAEKQPPIPPLPGSTSSSEAYNEKAVEEAAPAPVVYRTSHSRPASPYSRPSSSLSPSHRPVSRPVSSHSRPRSAKDPGRGY